MERHSANHQAAAAGKNDPSLGREQPSGGGAAGDGFTIWLTGLVGAGKGTIARELESALLERGQRVEVLDGKQARLELSRGLGYSKEDRDLNVARLAFVAHLLARNGVVAIVAAVSPYRQAREAARLRIGRFVEVYVRCPVDELVRRDTRGVYASALRGEVASFTGVSDPYEEPIDPEVVVETDRESTSESVARIIRRLGELGYLVTGELGKGHPQAARQASDHVGPRGSAQLPSDPPRLESRAGELSAAGDQTGRSTPLQRLGRVFRLPPFQTAPAPGPPVAARDDVRSAELVERVAEVLYRRTVRNGGWALEIGGLGPGAFADEATEILDAIALGRADQNPPIP
jgi:adenylylsulfate kinase